MNPSENDFITILDISGVQRKIRKSCITCVATGVFPELPPFAMEYAGELMTQVHYAPTLGQSAVVLILGEAEVV